MARTLNAQSLLKGGLAMAVFLSVQTVFDARVNDSSVPKASGVQVSATSSESKAWSPTPSPVLNVRAFGARGDGLGDDTAAFQRAIDAAPLGASVYVPDGTYRIAHPPLTLKSYLRLFGNGPSSTINDAVGNRSLLSINDDESVVIEGLRLTGSGRPGVDGRGAIWAAVGSSFGTRNSRFENNTIEGVGTTGIVVGNSSNVTIRGNTIVGAREHGIYVSGSTKISVSMNAISDVGDRACGACSGIKVANSTRVTVTLNRIRSPSQVGLLLDNGTRDSLITRNTIHPSSVRSIRIEPGAFDNTVASNTDAEVDQSVGSSEADARRSSAQLF